MAPGVPDYVLYKGAAAVEANKTGPSTRRCCGKAPSRSETPSTGTGHSTFRSRAAATRSRTKTSFQIAFYMQHAGTEWGDLTNGQLWRL
jgi:hypothetical protein